MAKTNIINPIEEQHRKAALGIPHNLFVVDEILDVTIDGFWGGFSLGFKNPLGNITPALTVKMSLPAALSLAKQIIELANSEKESIAASYAEVQKTIAD